MELILDEDGWFNTNVVESIFPNISKVVWDKVSFKSYLQSLSREQLDELGLRLHVLGDNLGNDFRNSKTGQAYTCLCDDLEVENKTRSSQTYQAFLIQDEAELSGINPEIVEFCSRASEMLNKARQTHLDSLTKNGQPAQEETKMELIIREDGWFNPTVLQDIFSNLETMEWEKVNFKPYLQSLSRDQLDELGSRLYILGYRLGKGSLNHGTRCAYERLCNDLEAENKTLDSRAFQDFLIKEEQNLYLNSSTKDEQPIQDEPTSIEATLAQRKATHGDYADVSRIYCNLQRAVSEFLNDDSIPPEYRLSVNVILQKISRIAAGNPAFADHWHDIEGYARLAKTKVESDEKI
jgi:hypothetical protein